jgi:hypothetical protein
MSDIAKRITDYLMAGGLHNPELANHDAVRDLLIDARAEVDRLCKDRERLDYADRKGIGGRAAIDALMALEQEGEG